MKKALLALFLSMAGMLFFSVTAYAGNINSAEQEILNTISETQNYNGESYRVTDAYIAKVREYLSRDDVDLTRQEANSYIAQFRDNIAVGISSGYLEKIGGDENSEDSDSSESQDPSGDQDPSANANDSTDGVSSGTETGSDPAGNISEGTEEVVIEDNTIGSTTDGVIEYTVLSVDESTMYVWDTDTLEVHAEAYKDSEVIGVLEKGDAVTVIGAASTGWAQIKYDDLTGYVSAVYLRTQKYMNDKEEIEAETVNETESESETGEEKDYSNAAPVTKQVNIAMIALIIVVIFCIIMGIVIFLNRSKMKNRVKNKFRK